MTLFKIYEKLENGQEIKMSISFNRDKYNWGTGQSKRIGYEVSVVPIQRSADGMWESFSAFSGFNDTLIECSRQGSRRLEMAIDELNQRKERYLNQFREGGRYAIK